MKLPANREWAWIVVCSSGGKDSQTALRRVVQIADACGYPRDQIVVSHQDLGRMEWKGSKEIAQEQAEHYGLRVEVSWYRDKDGARKTLLEYVKKRGKWPENTNTWCTLTCQNKIYSVFQVGR